MEQQRVETKEQVLPPQASRSGKNTTYIGCEVRHARQNYGVCLFIVEAYEQDRLDQNMKDCARAMAGQYCPAAKMKKEEYAAGKALYYKEREIKVATITTKKEPERNKIDKSSDSYIRGWNAVKGSAKRAVPSSTNTTTRSNVRPITAKPVKAKSEFERGLSSGKDDLIETINSAAKETVKKSEAKPEPKKQVQQKDSVDNDAKMKRAQRIAKMMKGRQNAKQ